MGGCRVKGSTPEVHRQEERSLPPSNVPFPRLHHTRQSSEAITAHAPWRSSPAAPRSACPGCTSPRARGPGPAARNPAPSVVVVVIVIYTCTGVRLDGMEGSASTDRPTERPASTSTTITTTPKPTQHPQLGYNIAPHTYLAEHPRGLAHLVVVLRGVRPVGRVRQRHVDGVEEAAPIARHLTKGLWVGVDYVSKTVRRISSYGHPSTPTDNRPPHL